MLDISIPGFRGRIDRHASSCPICNQHMVPNVLCGATKSEEMKTDLCLEICYQCTNIKCQTLFIGVFREYRSNFGNTTYYDYCASKPKLPEKKVFPEAIKANYERFVDIYNQAYAADQYGLVDVCGPGYRKALEFLIKTYLIKRDPGKEDQIKDAQLANCISNFLKNDNIKTVVARATWLGNDETHFVRKWEDKDITYLKGLIQLTVNWIDMEEMTSLVVLEMPNPKKEQKDKT